MKKMFSVMFYDYNSRDYLFPCPLKPGDIIETVEFNQTTQLYDVKLR